MSRFRLTAEAENDLDDIRRYLTEVGGTPIARRVLREFRLAIELLVRTPGAGHARDNLTDEPVKFWSVFSYMVIYDPSRPLTIIRVLHGSQDLEKLFRKAPPRP